MADDEPEETDPAQNDAVPTAMKIRPVFAWYDCWIGLFFDTAKRKLYIFPVPMFGVVIELPALENRLG